MKNRILIYLLMGIIIITGCFLIYQQQNSKILDQYIEVLEQKIEISKNNVYRDKDNGFEFTIPFNMEISFNSFHDDSAPYSGDIKIGNFEVIVRDKQEYLAPGSISSYYKTFYNKNDNSWYESLIINHRKDVGDDFDGETIESTAKICDNKRIINSQPFYFARLGEEGWGASGYFVLLSNGKLVSFTVEAPERLDQTGYVEKGEQEIVEVLKSFKTLGQVKSINTVDCK